MSDKDKPPSKPVEPRPQEPDVEKRFDTPGRRETTSRPKNDRK